MIYTPLAQENKLVIGKASHLAVVTGWTPVDTLLLKGLNLADFAVMGNLYSPSLGIDYLVRNLLANPQITTVLGLFATKHDRGAMTALQDFFSHGVTAGVTALGKPVWNINTGVTNAFFSRDIPLEALDQLRGGVVFCRYDHAENLVRECPLIPAHSRFATPRPAQFFPMSDFQSETSPRFGQESVGTRIQGDSVATVWVKALQRLVTTGKEYPTRYGSAMHEVENLMTVITDDRGEFPPFFPTSAAVVRQYQHDMVNPPQGEDTTRYSYGNRIRHHFPCDQLEQVAQLLSQNPHTRAAVINLWDVQQDPDSLEPPCLNHLWFRLRDGHLDLTSVFRSNDMFSAWVQNAFGLLSLMDWVRNRLGVARGTLTILSQSAHIYSDCYPAALEVVQQEYLKRCAKHTRLFSDPVGNFLVEVVNAQIQVTHLNTQGEKVQVIQGIDPLALGRELVYLCPMIEPAHALYLGMEIQNAAISLEFGLPFVQDQVW